MAKKKTPGENSFTSFRIIGEKAQKLLSRAREMARKGQDARGESKPLILKEDIPEVKVVLSITSIVKATLAIVAVALSCLLLYTVKDTLVLLLLGLFVAIIIDPGVNALQRIGVPRGLAVLLIYFVALFFFVFLIVSLIPIIAAQLQSIAITLNQQVNAFLANPQISLPLVTPHVNEKLTIFLQNTLQDLHIQRFTDALNQFGQNLSTAAQGSLVFAAHLGLSVVNFFFSMILVLVLAFFIQLEKEQLFTWFRGFLPWDLRSYMDDKSEVIHWKLAQWARGQLVLCFCIGFLVFLALLILRMPYALTLAILAGFTEFIPVIGPLLAAIPAVLIATTQEGLIWGLVVAGVYYIIQWCENNLIVPLIMKRAVGLSPIAIMSAMLVAVSFPDIIHPILGVILSIPLTTILALFLEDLRTLRREKLKSS